MGEQCLRPEFTQQLLASLLHGESINLIGPHGQGRRRTLQDLRRNFPESWRVFQVDMRDVEKRASSLLNELLKQADIENICNIHDFMYEMNKKSIYQLIIIHNFHFLTDLNVISCLNEIEKYPYLSLLCVSEEKQQKPTLSAKDCILPWLTSKQLRAEINRRKLALEEDNIDLLIDFLLHQTSPYSWLDSKPESWFVDALWKSEVQQKSSV